MNAFVCPLCRLPLNVNPQGLTCEHRHQFDRAKEGYYNLLPVHFKHSREPGDAKEQLQARQQFLQAGFFASLQQRLQDVVPADANNILDIGCGEGYFTQALAQVVPQAQVYGIDIAKIGVRLAAKAAQGAKLTERLHYAVASSADLPIADGSMDLVTRVYAPSKDAELYRVMSAKGLLVIVTPGAQHLLGLRQRIYREVRAHQSPPIPEGFALVAQEQVRAELRLDAPEMCAALLEMTPFAWRMSPELKAEMQQSPFEDTLDFVLTIYNKI